MLKDQIVLCSPQADFFVDADGWVGQNIIQIICTLQIDHN